MELRNGINCIEPLLNNNTQSTEAVFLPCNFQDEQKWNFFKLNNDQDVNSGMLINVATEKCLTFTNIMKQDSDNDNRSMKKSKMLSMLATLVRDSVDKVQSPYLITCDKSTSSINFKSQIWLLD